MLNQKQWIFVLLGVLTWVIYSALEIGGQGRHEIGVANGFRTCGAWFYFPWPTNYHGDSMSAFPDLPLGASQRSVRVVPLSPHSFRVRSSAIVAGNDEQGFFGQIQFIKGAEDFPNGPVKLDHEIPVPSCIAFALKAFVWSDREVNVGRGVIEEERLVSILPDEAHGFGA